MRWLALAAATSALVPAPRQRRITRIRALPQATVDLKARAQGLLEDVERNLADGAALPGSAQTLRAAYATDEHNDIYVAFLEFFMDLKLDYDVSEGDGSLGSDSICPSSNPLTDLEDKDTREKLPMLYRTAMTMLDGATPEVQLGIWKLVVDKLIDRTGMSNKEFVAWSASCLKDA